ncbi:MAG: DivIVA domain-containing protein [Solirubrobacteraceae bacterium]|jgi:cell division septum initiation protein DivIVA
MSDFDRSPATVEGPARRRPAGSRIADLGDRLARTFGTTERSDHYQPAWDATADAEPEADWQQPVARFPTARHGYDRAAVDEAIAELEAELDALRAHKPTKTAVAAEIEQIGEQAAAILRVAHDQAHQTTRRAQTEADKCLSDAAANALAMTDEARLKVRELDREADAIWRERARLVDDVRNIATSLFSLAEDATDRFPAEAERAIAPALPAAQPSAPESPNGHVSQPTEEHSTLDEQ